MNAQPPLLDTKDLITYINSSARALLDMTEFENAFRNNPRLWEFTHVDIPLASMPELYLFLSKIIVDSDDYHPNKKLTEGRYQLATIFIYNIIKANGARPPIDVAVRALDLKLIRHKSFIEKIATTLMLPLMACELIKFVYSIPQGEESLLSLYHCTRIKKRTINQAITKFFNEELIVKIKRHFINVLQLTLPEALIDKIVAPDFFSVLESKLIGQIVTPCTQ